MTQIERALGGYALLILVAAMGSAAVATLISYLLGTGRLRPLLWGGLVGSIVCILGITLAPSVGTPTGVEFVPFTRLGTTAGVDQLICNLALTAPSGLLSGLATRNIRQTICLGIVLCLGIEAAQVAIPLGRIGSTEDALATSIGWIGGSFCATALLRLIRNPRRAV